MSFPYKKALIIGATSGIGKALAIKFVENGTKVVIAGRRKENLDEFAQEYGSEMVDSRVFDVMKLEQVRPSPLPSFRAQTMKEEMRFNHERK